MWRGGQNCAVVGVIGGHGGVGASSLAAVLAHVLRGLVVDVDPVGGGLDVLLGIEAVPGARWSGLRLEGGRLDPRMLADGLPRWRRVPVLAVDSDPPCVDALERVIDASVAAGAVVLDLPRAPSVVRDKIATRCSLVVVLTRASVRSLAATRSVIGSLPSVPVGVVVRPGEVTAEVVGQYVGAPVLGVLRGPIGDLSAGRVPKPVVRVAEGIASGLGSAAVCLGEFSEPLTETLTESLAGSVAAPLARAAAR